MTMMESCWDDAVLQFYPWPPRTAPCVHCAPMFPGTAPGSDGYLGSPYMRGPFW